jgi:hypothetical protein
MIKARHNPLVYRFFQAYARFRIRSNFHTTVVKGDLKLSGKAVLLLSNHISWWDGFWALYLNQKYFQKRFHFMMDEDELRKRWLFSLSGGYSIRRNSRSLFESLHYTEELLKKNENMVVIYPQGKLFSSHTPYVQFKKGIERLNFDSSTTPDIYFLVQLTDYFQYDKPTLFYYLQKASDTITSTRDFETAYNDFYRQSIEQHSQLTV